MGLLQLAEAAACRQPFNWLLLGWPRKGSDPVTASWSTSAFGQE